MIDFRATSNNLKIIIRVVPDRKFAEKTDLVKNDNRIPKV